MQSDNTPADRPSSAPPFERVPAMRGLRTEAHCWRRIVSIVPEGAAFIQMITKHFEGVTTAKLLRCIAEMNDNKNICPDQLAARVGISYSAAFEIKEYLLKTVYA